ncbi:hypothetical protein ACFTAO_10685 [Paenibacillus rhizoplanae]
MYTITRLLDLGAVCLLHLPGCLIEPGAAGLLYLLSCMIESEYIRLLCLLSLPRPCLPASLAPALPDGLIRYFLGHGNPSLLMV